jgi:predicted TIM-barrel fold metal-dependent hydrolase
MLEMSRTDSIKDDYFKIDVETHLIGDRKHIDYFPGMKLWWAAAKGITMAVNPKGTPPEVPKHAPEDLIDFMDTYGVDMACVLPEVMMPTTGYTTRWSTNGYVAEQAEKYPDRFIFCPNVGPLIYRGVKNAVQELDYLVKERNAKLVKFYPPEDTYINDPRIWPFYEKVNELGIPLVVHTGWAWVPPGLSRYSQPVLLEEVANDFPDMKIIALHMGWPYPDELNMLAVSHPNVYIGTSLIGSWAYTSKRQFAKLIGEAIHWATSDRIIWGSDWIGLVSGSLRQIEGLRDFQIPEDMQEDYGYEPLTTEDKRKIFGENLARLLNIEPRRRIKVK